MSWFKRESAPAPANAVQLPAHADAALARALDAVGALLREFGKGGLDLEPLRFGPLNDLCEQWAQHLMVGAPRPGVPDRREALPLDRRDWNGVRKFLAESRAVEGRAVGQTMSALQQSLWAALKALDGVVAGSGHADGQAGNEMVRLKKVANLGSAEEIKREVLSVVAQMEQIAREKARRQELSVELLRTQVRALGEELEVARQESSLDGLTRLYNRRAFDERCAQILAMARLFNEPSTLLLVDVDHFKQVNDLHGHPAGDAVLRGVADWISRSFVSRGDFVARYGGEEFAVLLWGAGVQRGKQSAERLVESIRTRTFEHEGKRLEVRVSVGVAQLQQQDSAAQWLERADRALYQAKSAGRDQTAVAQ